MICEGGAISPLPHFEIIEEPTDIGEEEAADLGLLVERGLDLRERILEVPMLLGKGKRDADLLQARHLGFFLCPTAGADFDLCLGVDCSATRELRRSTDGATRSRRSPKPRESWVLIRPLLDQVKALVQQATDKRAWSQNTVVCVKFCKIRSVQEPGEM